MSKNISTEVDWVARVCKRYHDTGNLIPVGQEKLYTKIRDHWCMGRTVIDIGCSLGVGSNILSHYARFVWGVDISEDNVRFATKCFKRPNLNFDVLDIEKEPERGLAQFDVVVVSEVIEHLEDVEAGLSTIKKFFSTTTTGFITIPNIANKDVEKRDRANGLHLHHWTAGDGYELMTKHFQHVVMFSVDKLDTWDGSETIDGNSKDGLVVFKVETPIYV